MDRFAEIQTYVAVVEAGSLLAAADRLGIAVSAVSRRIAQLETRLGVRLANRSTRGFAPTPSGLAYYERCVRVLADLTEADASLIDTTAAVSGVLRVALPLAFSVRYLAPVLNQFAVANPALVLDLNFSDRQVDLIAEGVDFAVRIGEIDDSQLIAKKLFDVDYLVAASPSFWQQHGYPKHPKDLTGLPALAYNVGINPARWHYTEADGSTGSVLLKSRYIATDGQILVEAARAGLGVCLEPTFISADFIKAGQLQTVLTDFHWYQRTANVVYPKGRPLPLRAKRLIKHLCLAFAKPNAWN